ncbi:MAG: tRNA (adenosine(37)-N6)-threonylcarbamoyltransferase complex ATPase subunit type 1 TsaE [Duodenibacillus sp.]|nr:tRNA (adenosine(37)-N6)-threonylcarbamoyltransferase complex ATPase subunit type 1 TsaE [Duodenibacillus sp.]
MKNDPCAACRTLELASEEDTGRLARALAAALAARAGAVARSGFNLRLTGDLGAGKTALTRAMLRALGVAGRVRSPTFELVEDYDVLDGAAFHHFDFYRFASPEEFEEAGFRDLFGPGRVTACEWSEKAGPYLPAADLEIELTVQGAGRRARVAALSALGEEVLAEALA